MISKHILRVSMVLNDGLFCMMWKSIHLEFASTITKNIWPKGQQSRDECDLMAQKATPKNGEALQ